MSDGSWDGVEKSAGSVGVGSARDEGADAGGAVADREAGSPPVRRLKVRRKAPIRRAPEPETRSTLTAEERFLVLDAWKRSALPASEFSKIVQVSPHTLNAWRRQGLSDHPRGVPRGSKLPEARGLGGCYLYAVQPVGPNGTLGQFRKILSVNTTAGDNVTTYTQPQDEFPDSTPGHQPNPDHDDEIERLNVAVATVRAGSPGGPTDPPGISPVPFASTGSKPYPWVTGLTANYPADSVGLKVTFAQNLATLASDLTGYHVEMAGSINGPWTRITTHPIAWWEAEYSLRGLGADLVCVEPPPDPPYYCPTLPLDHRFYGSHDCAHVRLIAVDEDGNESAPAYPNYPVDPPSTSRAGCSLLPTPGAPQNLVAVGTSVGGGACDVVLTWSQVPEAVAAPAQYEYAVYRLTFPNNTVVGQSARYFYRTKVVEATSCVGGACTYVEEGDAGAHVADPNFDCPYRFSDACANTGTQAFYVTVRRKAVGSEFHGGESPRSQIVFWDCSLGDISQVVPTEAGATYFAGARPTVLPADPVIDLAVCEVEAENEDVTLAQSPLPLDPDPAVAPLLFLGQAPPPIESPGYRVIDLHVDQLGSVRLATDELGQVTARHDFLPFGEEIFPSAPNTDPNTKMFTGHERDRETGLDYMLGRYYTDDVPSFITPDPIGGRTGDPQSFNLYTYVRHNPLLLTDPSGLTIAQAPTKDVQALIDEGMPSPEFAGTFTILDILDTVDIGFSIVGIGAGIRGTKAHSDIWFEGGKLKGVIYLPATLRDPEVLGHELEHFEEALEAGKTLDLRMGEPGITMRMRGQNVLYESERAKTAERTIREQLREYRRWLKEKRRAEKAGATGKKAKGKRGDITDFDRSGQLIGGAHYHKQPDPSQQ